MLSVCINLIGKGTATVVSNRTLPVREKQLEDLLPGALPIAPRAEFFF